MRIRRKDYTFYLDEFRLQLLTDKDMLLMFEKDIRDGAMQAVKCYAKQYLEANNLYEWAVIHKLPTHGFTCKK